MHFCTPGHPLSPGHTSKQRLIKSLAVGSGQFLQGHEKLGVGPDISVGTLCLRLTRCISEMLILKKKYSGHHCPSPGFSLCRKWECWASAAFRSLGSIENLIKGTEPLPGRMPTGVLVLPHNWDEIWEIRRSLGPSMAPRHCHDRGLKSGNGCSWLSAQHCMCLRQRLTTLSCPGCGGPAGARQTARAENGSFRGAGRSS